jgi:hypothetical protein
MPIPPPPNFSDRLWSAFRALVRQEINDRLFGIYEYSIEGTQGSAVNAVPTDPSIGLPAIANLPLDPGLLGESISAPPAGLCRVAFLNGDRSKPCVIGISASPLAITIGSSSLSTKLGPLPISAATAPPLVTALAAVNTAILAIHSVLQQMTMGWSSLSPSQQDTFNGAVSTATTALTTTAASPSPVGVVATATQIT